MENWLQTLLVSKLNGASFCTVLFPLWREEKNFLSQGLYLYDNHTEEQMVVYRPDTITLDSSYTRVTTIATRWGEWMEWRPPPGLMCGSYSTFTNTFTQDHRLNYRNITVLARNTTGKLLQIQVFTNPRTLDSCPRACLGKCGKSSINRCFLAPRESHLAYSSPKYLVSR